MTAVDQRPEGRLAQFTAVTLDAYHAALARTDWRLDEPSALVVQLGGVDRHAAHPAAPERLAIAGRLIAIAQLTGPRLSDAEVRDLVADWLGGRLAEWDDAAPSLQRRIAPEDEHVAGLDASLSASGGHGGVTCSAWAAASYVLRHLVRPELPMEPALRVAGELERLSAEALTVLGEHSPFGLGGAGLDALLLHLSVRVRCALRLLTDECVDWEQDPRRDWVHIAAAAAGAHAAWTGRPPRRSLRRATGRAIDRLASSLVPDDPRRFPRLAALAHVRHVAFDTAVTALGMELRGESSALDEERSDALDGLLEAAGSGLIGAWVAERLA